MTWEDVEGRLVSAISASLARPDLSSAEKLEAAFQTVSAYGAARLKPMIANRSGEIVQSGPFSGMQFLGGVSEGAYIPKILGSYEAELHAFVEQIVEAEYEVIINIGCAEGYYAVGLARRTSANVHAFDIDETAQEMCRKLAERNGVQDRLSVGGVFQPGDFANYANRRVLVLCDIEGAETALLDPDASPTLLKMDMLVEIHRVDGRWTSDVLFPRFEGSHTITEVAQQARDAANYPALGDLSDRDRFFALLERMDETRWAFFAANGKS